MGVPVVATNVRGCRQVVDDGVTGLLVPARDPRALAAAIGKLASAPELRRRVRRRGPGEGAPRVRRSPLRRDHAGDVPPAAGEAPRRRRRDDVCGFATDADVHAVAALHAERIAEGFLVTLGPAFLRRLYRRIVRVAAARS